MCAAYRQVTLSRAVARPWSWAGSVLVHLQPAVRQRLLATLMVRNFLEKRKRKTATRENLGLHKYLGWMGPVPLPLCLHLWLHRLGLDQSQ